VPFYKYTLAIRVNYFSKEKLMKVVKLSLSTALLISLFSNVSSATPLEDVIKDVEIGGLARYRFYGDSDVAFRNGDKQLNRFTSAIDIVTKVSDDIKFGTTLMVDRFDNAQNGASGPGSVEVRRFWFQYFGDDFDVKLGKLRLITPWTNYAYAGTHGNGVEAKYMGIEKLMFIGGYYNQVNGFTHINKFIPEKTYGQEDFFYAGAVANIDSFTAQAWASRMTNIFDLMAFFDLSYKYENLRLRGQANYVKLASEQKKLFADNDGIFYGFEAEYKTDTFFVNAGYTKNDEDMPIFTMTADNNMFIQFGDSLQLIYKGANLADAKLMFLKGGVTFDKLSFESGYGHIDVSEKDKDMDEYFVRAKYKMSKNLVFTTLYSILESEEKDQDNNRLHFDLAYFF
jgi:hypothetical protein